MTRKYILLVATSFLITSTAFAQVEEADQNVFDEVNQHKVFNQTNGISYNLFDSYEYDHQFGNYRFIPASQSLRYNRVDGLFMGVGTDFATGNNNLFELNGLLFDGFIGYSTAQKDWQYRAGVSKPFGNTILFGGEILNTTTTGDYWRTGLSENSISALVAGYDYHDFYNTEGYSLFSQLNLNKFISVAASYNYTLYNTLNLNTEYSFFNGGNIGRINPAVDSNLDQINQESLGFKLTINKKGLTSGNVTSKFLATAELSDEAWMSNNDFNYSKFEITSLNYLKLDRNTFLKVRLMGGSITGTAPDFKSFALGGIGSLRASSYKFYTGNKMLMSNTEVIFGDFWSHNKGKIDIDGLYFSLFYDTGWTDFVANTSNDPLDGFQDVNFKNFTHNVGVGVGVNMLRLEVATPVARSEGFTAIWLRINPTF